MASQVNTGSQKAAILLLSFGEDISSEIFKHLNEFEVRRIGTAMSRLGRLEEDVVKSVINEFHEILKKNKQFLYGGTEYTKKLIGNAFKTDKADKLIEQLSLSATNLDCLELIEPRTLAEFIRNEHPQTIALILAYLDPIKCGETVKLLPDSLHTEVLMRMANIESVSPEIVEEINEVLRSEIQTIGTATSEKVGGVESIAEVMNVLDKATEEELLDNLEERDPDLAEDIRQLMFVFDDLVKIDDRGIQELIKAVSTEKWKIALKTCSEAVQELVFKNMSERAAAMLKEDMEAMPAVKLSDVETAQYDIVQAARKLEEEGKIIMTSSTETAYV